MKTRKTSKFSVPFLCTLGVVFLLMFAILVGSGSKVSAQGNLATITSLITGKYVTVKNITTQTGKHLTDTIIHGPPVPPAGLPGQPAMATGLPASAKMITVPAYTWEDGCSAVSAAMIAGYYDNNGYPNIYTGPTNGGLMPYVDSSWPTWTDVSGSTYPNNPLIASHYGVDGRGPLNGSIDDYWVEYGSTAPDPFITGSWTQHTWGDAISDYMKTSQSNYSNTDGSTQFWGYYNSPQRYNCSDMETDGVADWDGTYGMKLFYEARGYTVTDCYNQSTDNIVAGGFSLADYKAQIDAGHPVMLTLNGHNIVGVGYESASSRTIYVHDTWDLSTIPMTWGTSFSGMQLLMANILNLASTTSPTVPTIQFPYDAIFVNKPTFSWTPVPGATKYSFSVYKGKKQAYSLTVGSNACDPTTCSSTPNSGLGFGDYTWKVRAYVGGAWNAYSTIQNFTITVIKPQPGFWQGNFGDEFYVNPDENSVNNIAVEVDIAGCGAYRITHTARVPIHNDAVSFNGAFYGTGTFTSTVSLNGLLGLDHFYLPGCGYVNGGPWADTLNWQNSIQASRLSGTVENQVGKIALPNLDALRSYHSVEIVAP
ncbi:MAG: C39 family peptidase [Anaerolineales bacterium]